MIYKFKIAKNDEYGFVGLQPTWLNRNQSDPVRGMGIAHDILEHTPKDVCEFQATGAIIWLRGNGGYFAQRVGISDPVENAASDFTLLANYWHYNMLPDPGRTTRVEADDDTLRDIIQRGVKLLREEGWRAEDTRVFCSEENRRRMLGWMRKGYRACAKRWRAFDPCHMSYVFQVIEKAADEFLKQHDCCEGATAVARVNIAAATCSFRIEEGWEE